MGTLKLIDTLGINQEQVAEIRYRGYGWPGTTKVKLKGNNKNTPVHQMTYEQSWGNILSKYIQFRCHLCPDSTGELADISCGDLWYKQNKTEDPGQSLILIRTKAGRTLWYQAIKAGFIIARQAKPASLPVSQNNLLNRRRYLWGQLLTMHAVGVPIPRYIGFPLLRNWFRLSTMGKLYSVGGTLKRIISHKWFTPLKPTVSGDKLQN